jgi:hypothetical protein
LKIYASNKPKFDWTQELENSHGFFLLTGNTFQVAYSLWRYGCHKFLFLVFFSNIFLINQISAGNVPETDEIATNNHQVKKIQYSKLFRENEIFIYMK